MKHVWLAFVAMVLLCLGTISVSQARPPQRFFPDDDWTSPYHLVHRGETLTSIARLYAPDRVQELRDANGIVGDRIYSGEYLRLPDSWFYPSNSTLTPVTAPTTPAKKETSMPFDPESFMTMSTFTFIFLVVMAIVYLLMQVGRQRPAPTPPPAPTPVVYILQMPAAAMPTVHVDVHHRHGFPAGGIPVSVTMTTPPATPPTS